MSLESQIADLVTATNNLINTFNTKKAGIEAAVAAAIVAVPATSRNWYVDQVNGLDTNAGTAAAPFRTINKAMAATPESGVCNINMLSDYTLDVQMGINCALVVLKGEGGIRTLRPKYYPLAEGGVTTENRLGGFVFQRQGSQMEIREMNIVLPTAIGLAPAPINPRLNSLCRTYGSFMVPPFMALQMNTVTITKEAGFFGALIGASSSCLSLGCGSVSFPTDFGGFYLDGVAAGTDSKSVPRLVTNLVTL